jgi:hypothetical protein
MSDTSPNAARRAAGLPEEPAKTFTQGQVNAIVQDRLERDRKGRLEIIEPRTYGIDSPDSFYADIYHRHDNDAAQARLDAHAREVACEVVKGSPEGRRAERIMRNGIRSFDEYQHRQRVKAMMEEVRTLATGGGATASASGGGAAAFVPPFGLEALWAPYRARERSFADQCWILPLPSFGMHGYIPAFISPGLEASLQTEAASLAEKTPGAGLEGSEVKTAAGKLTITKQLLDRAFGQGGNIDVVIGQALRAQVEEQADIYALTQALAGGTSVKGGSEFKFETFYKDLQKSRAELADAEGTRLRASHLFTTSDQYDFISGVLDESKRPILAPQFMPGVPPAQINYNVDPSEESRWSRFTGTVLPGGVFWFTDDNIPELGTTGNTQLIVAAPQDAIVMLEDADCVTSVFEEPAVTAGKMEVVITERKYVCPITRHASGTSAFSGNGYPVTNK